MSRGLKPDEPFRITFDFIIAWVVITFPSLWFARPWDWDLPLYSIISGMIFIPFAATIILYCPIMFIRSILTSGSRGILIAKVFFGVASVTIVILLMAFIFGGFKPIDAWTVVLVSFWASSVMGAKIDNLRSDEEKNDKSKFL